MKGAIRSPLQSPCEVAARDVMPSIRASIAYVLTTEMRFSKYEAAKLLGVTPAAVANYLERKRGDKYLDEILKDPQILEKVREAATLAIVAKFDQKAYADFQRMTCLICSLVNEAAKTYGCSFIRLVQAEGGGLKH
ncbi:MAG: transcriptional regulator [Acidilobus sp.]